MNNLLQTFPNENKLGMQYIYLHLYLRRRRAGVTRAGSGARVTNSPRRAARPTSARLSSFSSLTTTTGMGLTQGLIYLDFSIFSLDFCHLVLGPDQSVNDSTFTD